jgi:hypothetical protein
MSVDGGEPRAVLEVTKAEAPGVAGFSWAPDGKSLVLVRRVSPNDELRNVELRQVLIVPLEGGPPRKTELTVKGLMRPELHPDGKTIFFQAGSPDYRIFRTENYLPAHD